MRSITKACCHPLVHVATGGGSGGRGGSSGGSAAPNVLSMLGYGTPTALANDSRVNPRAWQHGRDADGPGAAAGQLRGGLLLHLYVLKSRTGDYQSYGYVTTPG